MYDIVGPVGRINVSPGIEGDSAGVSSNRGTGIHRELSPVRAAKRQEAQDQITDEATDAGAAAKYRLARCWQSQKLLGLPGISVM